MQGEFQSPAKSNSFLSPSSHNASPRSEQSQKFKDFLRMRLKKQGTIK